MNNTQKQCLLKYLGYYVGEIDGKWGQLSETACKAFQADYGIEDDGKCGKETQKAMKHAVAYGMPAKKAEENFWDGIKYFKRSEFACKCGGKYCDGFPVEPKKLLVQTADKVRAHFGAPATVSSGVRCEQHNANVGGVSGSRHKLGKAMDFSIKGVSGKELLAYAQAQPEIRYAYLIEGDWVHMDIN